MKGITTDMPPDVVLIRADLIRVGDRVRFRMSSADYTVEEVETDGIGHVRHRTDNGTRTCGYHPGEVLWITRRARHTPGPWVVDMGSRTATVRTASGKSVARCYQGDQDAFLIASAPDLLVAIQALDDTFSHYCDGDPSPEEWAALKAARSAVAKATGDKP